MDENWNETLSNILGWMSIACWIVVYSPQLIENYQLKSGEGLSVLFILIWFAGDLCNLIGGILAGLLPTIIILAAYYIACDAIILTQIYYYRWLNSKHPSVPPLIPDTLVPGHAPSEETPLISGVNNAHEKSKTSPLRQFFKYALMLSFILGTGVAAWAVDESLHRGEPRAPPEEVLEWKSQLLGWISAILYIGARIPQILKNLRTKCEGLSPALFLFSIAGNMTYVLSILAVSVDLKHLVANSGWIADVSLRLRHTACPGRTKLVQVFWQQRLSLPRQRCLSTASLGPSTCPSRSCGALAGDLSLRRLSTGRDVSAVRSYIYPETDLEMACTQPMRPSLSFYGAPQAGSPNPPHYFDLFPPTSPVAPPGSSAGGATPQHPLESPLSTDSRPRVVPSTRTSSADLSINHLREALHNLDSRMASLLNERNFLESRLECAVRLQSPIQRLPSELLSSIFVAGVMDREEEEEDALMFSNIMLVCHHWRDVAVDTPTLWSRITAGVHHSLQKARLKLERSKSLPLNISVDFSPKIENGTVFTDAIVRTMELLQTSIWRWKTFRLVVPNRPQANAALACCRDPAPLLEVLSIRVLHSMQEDHHHAIPPRPFGGETPSLTFCSLTSFNFGWDIRLVSHLRTLSLSGYWNGFSPSADVILGIIRACPHLQEIVLRNMSDVEVGSCAGTQQEASEFDDTHERVRVSDTRMIQLPRLKKAAFYYSGTIRTRMILSLISCPALEEIELCFLDNVAPMIEHLHRQSLTRLPLRKLRIESSFFGELRLSKLLRRVPSLVTLELVDVEDVSVNLLRNLSTPPGSQTLMCPNLTSISFEGCTSLEWEGLRSLVEARLPAQSRAFTRPVMMTSTSTPSTASSSAHLTTVSTASGSIPRVSTASLAASSHATSTSTVTSSSSASSASSASAYAATAHILAAPTRTNTTSSSLPSRLQSIDLTRCHQITREMVQWLRMYVAEVKCDTQRVAWEE
ncbi:hypothetical protein NM688_g6535 [Phlebia brevispora]|uniref:Uncharacterized protein n=1 Tax=Phlebia brevispora TaxID=194682 RepID=A0ACC1SEY2_9APHY|nr:hypothetical protein NM688_g6535 [Phlebia brevispora]